MSDFKFTKFDSEKLDVDLIASIAKLLDANGIPNVMWGPYVLARYGAPLVLEEYSFVIPDQHIDRAREVLLAADFVSCQDDCHLVQPVCDLPHPYAHFILDDKDQPRVVHDGMPPLGTWHSFRLELHKKSQLLWTLPDIPLGAPAPDDPNYMLVTDDRLDEYDPRMHLGRVPYTHYPVKIPTLPRYAESLIYGHLRELSPEGEGHNRRAGFFDYEVAYIGLYCKLRVADLDEPRIRRFWRLRYHPSGHDPLFQYSTRLAAELRTANFFPEEEEGEREAQEST